MNNKLLYQYYRKYGELPKGISKFDNEVIDPISTLSQAFKLPPEAAVRFFESKGYVISWDWKSVASSMHLQSFTVAKVMQADLLQFYKSEIQRAIDTGSTFEEFKKNMDVRLEEAGWKGTRQTVTDPVTGKTRNVNLKSPSRLKTIYQTNLQSTYMQGRYEQMRETKKTHPYAIYTNADPKSDICKAVDGKLVRLDDPNLRIPPLHYRCKTTLDPVSEREAIRSGLIVVDAEKTYNHGGGIHEAFDSDPEKRWKPDSTKYDPTIAEELNKALGKGKA